MNTTPPALRDQAPAGARRRTGTRVQLLTAGTHSTSPRFGT
ncbi:hypothetical protein [Streptomyces werraensis]